MPTKPKVIIDTDAGTDDAAALFMLLEAHKKNLIELVAITTVNGNTTVDNVNINVYRVLETVQMSEIPVYPGASKGLVKKFIFPEEPFHGYDGFCDAIKDPLPSSLSLLQKEAACLALIHLVEENPGEIIVIAIGPLTNLAIAINIFPDWTSKLRDLYIMGGNIEGVGNITLMAEFNFACDPEAAKVVLEQTTIPIKLTPWETCFSAVYITFDEFSELISSGSPAANLIKMVAMKQIEKRKDRHDQWITCDELCTAWFLYDYAKSVVGDLEDHQALVTKTNTMRATIETSGEYTRGEMVLDRRGVLKFPPNIISMLEVNKAVYLKFLKSAF